MEDEITTKAQAKIVKEETEELAVQAEVVKDEVEVLADKHEVVEEFADALLTELSARLREMSKRESVDMVELLAVADELDTKRKDYAAKVKAV